MISKTNNFLYIGIPKTGSGTINQAFFGFSDNETIYVNYDTPLGSFEGIKSHNCEYNLGKHATLKEYKNKIEPNIYKQLFKFASIMNPWK